MVGACIGLASALSGCAASTPAPTVPVGPLPEVQPPVVSVIAHSAFDPRQWLRGQGIAVHNRVITAAHVVTRSTGIQIPRSLRINGYDLPVRSPMHGDLPTIDELYRRGTMRSPDAVTQDWVCFEVAIPHQITDLALSLPTHPPVNGETLYAVRVDPGEKADVYTYRVLTVTHGDFESEPLPERMTLVRIANNEQLPGWSGCFVGRYTPGRTPAWEFVGILIGQVEITGKVAAIVVIRPPDQALQWLTGTK